MKKSFYIISVMITLVVGFPALFQISKLIYSGVETPMSALILFIDCIYIFGITELFLKKQWAPALLSVGLVLNIIEFLTHTKFAFVTRIEASVIYLVLILLNVLVYKQLKAPRIQEKIQQQSGRDYWKICYRNFSVLAIFTGLATLLFLIIGLYEVAMLLLIGVAIFVVQARMFRKHSRKVIDPSYILLGLGAFVSVAQNILNLTFSLSDIIGYLLNAYLIYCIYRADKQAVEV